MKLHHPNVNKQRLFKDVSVLLSFLCVYYLGQYQTFLWKKNKTIEWSPMRHANYSLMCFYSKCSFNTKKIYFALLYHCLPVENQKEKNGSFRDSLDWPDVWTFLPINNEKYTFLTESLFPAWALLFDPKLNPILSLQHKKSLSYHNSYHYIRTNWEIFPHSPIQSVTLLRTIKLCFLR